MVNIGKVVGTFGLKGAVKVTPLTDFPERFDSGKSVFLNDRSYVITDCQWHKSQVRIWLEGIKKIDQAETLIGINVQVPLSDTPELEEGEFMVRDLLGLPVYEESGERLGSLDEVVSGPAQDVYRVGEILIPAVKEFVKEVNLKERRVVVKLLPGMKVE